MTFNSYIESRKQELRDFEKYYFSQHWEDSKMFPNEMEYGEFEEQERAYENSQEESILMMKMMEE